MPRSYKPVGIDSPAHKFRNNLMKNLWVNGCNGRNGEQFKIRYPSNYHYLYATSTFWLYYDLLLQTEEKKRQVNFTKHFEIGQEIDNIIRICAVRHEIAGDVEKQQNFKEPNQLIIEVNRDSYKSTLTRAGLIRILAEYPDWTNAYIRATSREACKGLKEIADHLQFNPDLHEFFPQLKVDFKVLKRNKIPFSKQQIGIMQSVRVKNEESDTEEVYAVRRNISPEPNIDAIGLDEQYTGSHKNGVVVYDDLVTEKNSKSKTIQESNWGKVGELENVASWTSVKIYDQTPFDEYDVFNRQKKILEDLQAEERKLGTGVEIFRHYRQPLFEHKGFTPQQLLGFILHPDDKEQYEIGKKSIVFPERHTPRDIKLKFKQLGKRFYYSQYLLEMVSTDEHLFREEWLTYYNAGEEPDSSELRNIGIIDPSGGSAVTSDAVGLLIAGIDRKNIVWIQEAMQERVTSLQLMEKVISLNQMYNGITWYMETYAMANQYRHLIQQILNERKHKITILELQGGNAASAKRQRIEGSSSLFESRKVRLQERHTDFIQQYKKYRYPFITEIHLLDAFGYLKDKLLPQVSADETVDQRIREQRIDTINDLHQMNILYINNEYRKKAMQQTISCNYCWTDNNGTQTKCKKCGHELFPIMVDKNEVDYEMMGSLN